VSAEEREIELYARYSRFFGYGVSLARKVDG
jgi:hypothetical protein